MFKMVTIGRAFKKYFLTSKQKELNALFDEFQITV